MGFSKRGQVAIFVIIALVIVGIILVLFIFPDVRTNITGSSLNPYSYLKECIEPSLDEQINLLAKQGGYANPEGFILYNDTKIKYLCHSSENYKTCMIQQPMIKNHFEQELNTLIAPKARECFNSLKNEYENRGYSVSSLDYQSNVEIIPDKIRINFPTSLTVNKESSQTYRGFEIDINSEMYDLLFIASSIVEYEATYGNSETTLYIQYYPELRIDKNKLSDGTTIYTLTNVITKENFTFASKSLVFPAGYGLE